MVRDGGAVMENGYIMLLIREVFRSEYSAPSEHSPSLVADQGMQIFQPM